MIEVRVHGRGGQGAVIASELLAEAAFRDGKVPQSFPFFGVERRGAPVTAFARIDDRPIGVRTSITEPDVVVVLDPGLLATTPVTAGLRDGGLLLVNTPRPPTELGDGTFRRASVDATRIARGHGLGSASVPIVNTAVLGALARATGIVTLEALCRAIEACVPAKRTENRDAAVAGFDSVRQAPATGRRVAPPPAARVELRLPEGPVADRPSDLLKTAAWRTQRPVLHLDRCTRCNFCWKYCPDDALAFDPQGYPVLRAEYCKGCGICAVECPPRAIEMVSEEA